MTSLTSLKNRFFTPKFTTNIQLKEWLYKATQPKKGSKKRIIAPKILQKIDKAISQNWQIDQEGAGFEIAIKSNNEELMAIMFKYYPWQDENTIGKFRKYHSEMVPMEYALLMGSYKVAEQWLERMGEEELQQTINTQPVSFKALLLYQTNGSWTLAENYKDPFDAKKRETIPLRVEEAITQRLNRENLKNLLVLAMTINQPLAERIIQKNLSNLANGYQGGIQLSEVVFSSSVEPDIQVKIRAIKAKYDKMNLESMIPPSQLEEQKKRIVL